MPKFFVTNKEINENHIKISGDDTNHIKNVLRKKVGEILNICNTDTLEDYLCKIIKLEDKYIELEITEKIENNVEPNTKVTILQGLPKADKMELIIQKSVELGAYSITPVEMKRCVVKLNEKDKEKKISRWQKISEVASKQSGRNIIPKINQVITIQNICQDITNYDIVIVAYEEEKANTLKTELERLKKLKKKNLNIAILIGPEGGIEKSEIEHLKKHGAKIVTLGNRILRTETVALNILSIIMYEFENKENNPKW